MQVEFNNLQQKILAELGVFSMHLEKANVIAVNNTMTDKLALTKADNDIIAKDAYIAQLEKQITDLKEEHRSFMSVSTIVSLTNENAKLKQTLAGMERSMFRREESAVLRNRNTINALPSNNDVVLEIEAISDATSSLNNIVVLGMTLSTTDTEQIDKDTAESLPEDAATFYEKTIKGNVYFVDETNTDIYANQNGEVGELVGSYIQSKDGKRKIRWLTCV